MKIKLEKKSLYILLKTADFFQQLDYDIKLLERENANDDN